ncbi:hypothetical protein [Shimia sp. MIT1388]|uniref:hypothetical protein n=1 Tax=Shimia sp. MIT1388 TaxID=3096992 RepID=UPI00399BEB68
MFHILTDQRVKCYSIMTSMPLGKYLDLVESAYADLGGVEGQRAPLKTKTATTIRSRLVSDIKQGAIVPPVVVGVLIPSEAYEGLATAEQIDDFLRIAEDAGGDRISIIDGMQRTTAMLEALEEDPLAAEREVRVEFWVAEKVNSLIYRMLVLNTGQVPWETGRQLETVYGQFLTQIKATLGERVSIFDTDDRRRRVKSGMYQSKNIIELLLLFSSRKIEIDVKDRVAEDFARLDTIETTSHSDFIEYFTRTLSILVELDEQFSRFSFEDPEGHRFKTGRDVFSSFPALAGFCSMVSVELFDEPGFDIDWGAAPEKMKAIESSFQEIVEKIKPLSDDALGEFLQLDLLEERLRQPSGQVGRFEREIFRRAFSSMLRNAHRISSLEPCWKA